MGQGCGEDVCMVRGEGVCEERVPCARATGACARMPSCCSMPCVIFCGVSSGSTAPRVAHGYERPSGND